MDTELEYLAPLAAAIADTIDSLDCLLICLATTRPAPLPFAVEQTVMHCATVLTHCKGNL